MSQVPFRSKFCRLKNLALGSATTAILLMAATAGAIAQLSPPNPGSLPGSFTTDAGNGTNYVFTTTKKATITVGDNLSTSGHAVLQWGGSALSPPVDPTGNTPPVPPPPSPSPFNPGFSIGAGAALTLTHTSGGGGAVLVNDLTGSPSQIFGKLTATGLGGPLYIANASGIIVGSTGSIAAPSQGVGLVAYPLASSTFDGTVSVGKGATGGDVTVDGAKISGGSLLVAGAGNVNVSVNMSCTSSCGVYSLSGVPFTTGPKSVVPTSITLPKPPPPPHHHHWW